MTEKSVSEQIIDEFIENAKKAGIIEKEPLDRLKEALISGRIKKDDILRAIGGEQNENP